MKPNLITTILLILVFLSCEELDHTNPHDSLFVLVAPTNLELLILSDSEIQISWKDNSEHEAGFYIERDQGNGFDLIVAMDANETVFIDTGLVVGVSYTYRVAGFTGVNHSDWATWQATTTTFPSPSDLTATAISDTEIDLTWKDNCDFEDGYRVERDAGSGFILVAVLNANIIEYSDSNLDYDIDYVYQISGFTEENISNWTSSGVISTTILSPDSLSITIVNNLELELNWSDNCSFEQGFRIDRDDGSGFEQIAELSSNVTTYMDVGLDYDTGYSYRVIAFTTDNISEYSNIETVTISSLEGMWNGIWKITSTTNQYSSSQLRQNETLTFKDATYDGSNVSGNVTMVSIYHGIVSGPFTYNPTGNTLVINYAGSPYEESFNGVVIDRTTLNFSNNDYSFTMTKLENVASYDAILWIGTWKVTATTNQFSSSQLSNDETLTFSGSTFDGSNVSGIVSLVSINHGIVSGSYSYNPTGQTLVINYTGSPYEESFNGVVIDGSTLSFSNNDYDFTLDKQEDITVFDASLWHGTWSVTNTTNQFSSSQLRLNETLTFSDATFNGTIVSGNTVMVSVYHGSVSGPYIYNPTGQTLVINYTGSPYEESFNGVVIDGTILSFSNSDYEFTLTKQ
jgi:hypothetical protein